MEELEVSEALSNQISKWRGDVQAIVEGKDDRLCVIVGPCSIHDVEVAKACVLPYPYP
jgi:3-deoxy-7-phosphoheptulonate synthase